MTPNDVAGRLHVRTGGARPTLTSTRRAWASQLGRGQLADTLPERLAALYSLCGGAHRVAARHAVSAARGGGDEVAPADRLALRADTLREHLRRLWLELPALAPALPAPDAAVLARSGLLRGTVTDAERRAWVEREVLAQPAADWLAGWRDQPAAFAAAWAAQGRSAAARLLAVARPRLAGLCAMPRALGVHGGAPDLQGLAQSLRSDAGFALAPTWRGRTAETGCWTRRADPAVPAETGDLWLRLVSRVADLARLVQPDGEQQLDQGALALGAGEGLGWCEMARGLLLHWVRLRADGRVDDCRLVAPTEWNFHPQGSAAQRAGRAAGDVDQDQVRWVLAAYDPCVTVTLEPVDVIDPARPCTR
jgi:hypothetical protein